MTITIIRFRSDLPRQFIIIHCDANLQVIRNCNSLDGRLASNFKESIHILKGLLAIAFGIVQPHRLHRLQPLITNRRSRPAKRFCDRRREGKVSDRASINVQSHSFDSWLCHHDSHEQEYRCTEQKSCWTEYECDRSDELVFNRSESLGSGARNRFGDQPIHCPQPPNSGNKSSSSIDCSAASAALARASAWIFIRSAELPSQ